MIRKKNSSSKMKEVRKRIDKIDSQILPLMVKRSQLVNIALSLKTRKSEIIDPDSSLQLNMFEIDDPLLLEIREQINSLEIDEIKPIEALMILNELRRKLSKN